MSAYKIIDLPNTQQTSSDLSFKGGIPNIPQRFEIPYCKLCGAEMTFFFQIAFPEKHVWEGKVMAFFQCASNNSEWPQFVFVEAQLAIPDDALDTYQTNFKIFIFDADEPVVQRYESKRVLKFERIAFERIPPSTRVRKVGGIPNWSKNRWDGTSPTELSKQISYMSGGVVFLMQAENDWTFERLPDAPPQFTHYKEEQPRYNRYSLFRGPYLYFLGTTSPQLNPSRVLLYALA
jgi:hypothetical protein